VKAQQRDQEYAQLNKQIESATRTVFGVLKEAMERNDPNLILSTLDRLIALIELRGKLTSTFVPAESPDQYGQKNGSDEAIAEEGSGGRG
jgi:hypothetical protein